MTKRFSIEKTTRGIYSPCVVLPVLAVRAVALFSSNVRVFNDPENKTITLQGFDPENGTYCQVSDIQDRKQVKDSFDFRFPSEIIKEIPLQRMCLTIEEMEETLKMHTGSIYITADKLTGKNITTPNISITSTDFIDIDLELMLKIKRALNYLRHYESAYAHLGQYRSFCITQNTKFGWFDFRYLKYLKG
jgi:hypothetical protein